ALVELSMGRIRRNVINRDEMRAFAPLLNRFLHPLCLFSLDRIRVGCVAEHETEIIAEIEDAIALRWECEELVEEGCVLSPTFLILHFIMVAPAQHFVISDGGNDRKHASVFGDKRVQVALEPLLPAA